MNHDLPMRTIKDPVSNNAVRKEGFILFYVMGTFSLMALAAMISLNSARMESRTARNHYDVGAKMKVV